MTRLLPASARLARLCVLALLPAVAPMAPVVAAEGERITVKGELIDTWCYYSGVMGSPEASVGTAHHTCAMWCSAGGVPVGLLADDGQVYMVLKIEGSSSANGGDTLLSLASDTITADGMVYRQDGLNYIVVSKVVSNAGITRLNHEEYGVVPDFVIPEPKK